MVENENNSVPTIPGLPVAEPPMDRAALLTAIGRAASATALGTESGDRQPRLDGKRFEVRIRFGCAPAFAAETTRPERTGAQAKPAATVPFKVRFDEQDRTLRVRAVPDLTLEDQQVKTLAGEAVEAVEGFWMYRPWLLTDGCPRISPKAPPIVNDETGAAEPVEPDGDAPAASVQVESAPAHRVGLAQFFTATDPRTRRRDGRAYEATKVLSENERPSTVGYNLVLSGRLRELPSKKVISCRVTDLDSPPQCIVSALFDRVWIEQPETKAVLAEWGS